MYPSMTFHENVKWLLTGLGIIHDGNLATKARMDGYGARTLTLSGWG
jgi:hypothetical protein